jgi:hypothetical protein
MNGQRVLLAALLCCLALAPGSGAVATAPDLESGTIWPATTQPVETWSSDQAKDSPSVQAQDPPAGGCGVAGSVLSYKRGV